MRKQQTLLPVFLLIATLISLPFLENLSWATSDSDVDNESIELEVDEKVETKSESLDDSQESELNHDKMAHEENEKTDDTSKKRHEENKKSPSKTNEEGNEEKGESKNKATEMDETSKPASKEESDNKENEREPQPITPFVGNLNVDIDISPHRDKTLAGNDALYNLVLKVTGSRAEYTDAKITIDLPITDYTQFTQDLSELTIDGIEPYFDADEHRLIYEFDSIKPGQSYETQIKVNTINGISPNDAKLTAIASFEANEQEMITDEAEVTVEASNSLSVSKKFREARVGGEVQKAPFPNSYTIWDIKVSIPKKDVGQLFLKEGSTIVITDTFDSGLTYYDVMDNTPDPSVSNRTLTWELDAPTIVEQAEAEGDLYTLNLRIRLRVNNDEGLIGTTLENTVKVEATTIDHQTIVETAVDTIPIINRESATGDVEGNVMHPNHFGPADGKGTGATTDVKDPNPDVYDDAYLNFRHGITAMHPGRKYDMVEYRVHYKIDNNLVLNNLSTPGNFYFARTQAEAREYIPLAKEPVFNILGVVNGNLTTLITNAAHGTVYTREDLGLAKTDHISEIRYVYTTAPAGMYARQLAQYNFDVKPGFVGQVKNEYDVHVIPDQRAINEGLDNNNGVWSYKTHSYSTWINLASDRHATIAPRPTDQPPIATIGIELLDHEGGEVILGNNRAQIKFANEASSTIAMLGPLEAVVLLPQGVTFAEEPKGSFTDSNNQPSSGDVEVLNNNYNNSGRQLVKITWDTDRIRIGSNITAAFDINISDNTPTSLIFDVYGFSGEEQLNVPSSSGHTITDTTLQTDEEDLNDNDITDEPRIKSGNIYTMRGQYDIQTQKLVKGELDEKFTHFGQTVPGGAIDYRFTLTNTTGKDITQMTLIDVLPSVGDLGITDNIDRGSQFTPSMTGPITLPNEWVDKVDIVYSTAKNPKRDDLTKHTLYPDTTTELSNPEGATDPNWITASSVTDWSTIHSFKMTLKNDVQWIKGDDITIEFSMQAPKLNDVGRQIVDSAIEPTERAAWNSFAIATDHGQPVEPLRVGVYMDAAIEEPSVEKTVNEQKEPFELLDRDEAFTWEIDYDFGNYTADWESASFSDRIDDLLEIIDVTIHDQDGTDVSANGELIVDHDENLVTFDLHKQNDSFTYLVDQTYTMIIKTKIREDVTEEQLVDVIKGGGIPNEAELIVNDDPTISNEVIVIPPDPNGSISISKVDMESRALLEGAAFELRNEADEIIATGITNTEGDLQFSDLPLGTYHLHETKAPEGYRILTQPIEIVIDLDHLHLELEIENSQSDWELPATGGIGTSIFYGIGALLMLGAAYFLFKRKRTNEPIRK